MNRFKCWRNRPRTLTTKDDIKELFWEHPVKTVIVLPIASLMLALQMIGYYISLPFAMLNEFVRRY